MKRMAIAATILTVALVSLSHAAGDDQKARVLLQAADAKAMVQGDLKGAIELYEKAVKEAGASRPLAAKALLGLGQCYEKIGNTEARKTYDRLVREYADQTDLVAQARARLAVLTRATVAPNPSGMAVRQVWTGPDVDLLGAPSPDGRYLSFVDWKPAIWRSGISPRERSAV